MKARDKYQMFDWDAGLTAFSGSSKIPLLQMEQLRQLDFPITRGVSYERTVDEFLLQLAVNDALRPLKNHKNMAVLLNEEGMLAEEDGRWILYFTPDRREHLTLAGDSDLYPVMEALASKHKKGEVCRIRVPDRSLKTIVSGLAPFCILDEYCRHAPGGYLAAAQKIVLEGTDDLYAHVPVCRYGDLSVVDLDEMESYHSISALLDDYLYACDNARTETRLKPLSIAVFGPPGAGKSFGVKQIARSRGRFQITSLNLSQYSEPGELFRVIDHALRCDMSRIPLVFFDEFDSERNGVSRGWLKYFLAPMQDGEYTLDGNLCSIPRAVFVFAGATASSFSEFLPGTAEEKAAFAAIKGPDFVSRLRGILNIHGPNPTSETDTKYIIRRAMLIRSQIVNSLYSIYDPETGRAKISPGLLSALLRVSEYRHGARSIELIFGMSRLAGVQRFKPSSLPMDAQLDIHLDVQDFRCKLAFEQVMGEMVEKYAIAAHKRYQEKRLREAELQGADAAGLTAIREEPEMADWENLDEFYKEGHRSQIRYLGEKLESYQFDIGLRPILEGAADTIPDLYGPVLEELSALEHERWMKDKRAQGWKYGKPDRELKLTPEMVPYADLEPITKEFIRVSVREVPSCLREIGYELYRKSFSE